MILTVTPNAALDVTWTVDRLVPRASHRVDRVRERAGGKGINVSRVLASLGHATAVTGLAGGPTGRLIRADLRAAGLRDELVPVSGDSRRTLTVVSREDGDATVLNPAGPRIGTAEWDAFTAHYARLVRGADVVVLSGSLPPGLGPGTYAELVRTAAAAGARTVVDTSGPPLLAALDARPDVVKPNAAELAAVTGHDDAHRAAAELRGRGAGAVVASLGPDGLLAHTPDGVWRAVPPRPLSGNPTGAGDACVAALAAGLAAGAPWPRTLCEAVALSAAAVVAPVAGDVDASVHRRFRTTVTLVPLEEPDAPHVH